MIRATKENEHAWLEITTRGWDVDRDLKISLSEEETLEQRPEKYSQDTRQLTFGIQKPLEIGGYLGFK